MFALHFNLHLTSVIKTPNSYHTLLIYFGMRSDLGVRLALKSYAYPIGKSGSNDVATDGDVPDGRSRHEASNDLQRNEVRLIDGYVEVFVGEGTTLKVEQNRRMAINSGSLWLRQREVTPISFPFLILKEYLYLKKCRS